MDFLPPGNDFTEGPFGPDFADAVHQDPSMIAVILDYNATGKEDVVTVGPTEENDAIGRVADFTRQQKVPPSVVGRVRLAAV